MALLAAFAGLTLVSCVLVFAAIQSFLGKLELTKGKKLTGPPAFILGICLIVAFVCIEGFAFYFLFMR